MSRFKPDQLADELAAELDNFVRLKLLIIEYGFSLEWGKMTPLVKEAMSVVEAFVRDVEQFIAFLHMIAGSHSEPD